MSRAIAFEAFEPVLIDMATALDDCHEAVRRIRRARRDDTRILLARGYAEAVATLVEQTVLEILRSSRTIRDRMPWALRAALATSAK